jgi:hypothetical protein
VEWEGFFKKRGQKLWLNLLIKKINRKKFGVHSIPSNPDKYFSKKIRAFVRIS